MDYITCRTTTAFQFSAERLAEQSKNLYFWTFTFKSVPLDDNAAMEDWDTLRTRLVNTFPWMQGLRVCELHRSHGIHFHTLVNGRIPIRRVFKIIYGSGHLTGRNRYLDFGRMRVTKCDYGTTMYMSKYLSKQYRKDYSFGGRRRWGSIGGFEQTKCADIIYDTPFQRNKPLLFGKDQIDYTTMLMMAHYTELWGDLEHWPIEDRFKVLHFATHANRDNGDRETTWIEPNLRRIDPESIAWSGHIETCGFCKYSAEGMCPKGQKLWLAAICGKWIYKNEEDAGMEANVTECNKASNMPDRTLPEVEERDSGKNFKDLSRQNVPTGRNYLPGLQPEKVNGRWIYFLKPRDYLRSVTIKPLDCDPF